MNWRTSYGRDREERDGYGEVGENTRGGGGKWRQTGEVRGIQGIRKIKMNTRACK